MNEKWFKKIKHFISNWSEMREMLTIYSINQWLIDYISLKITDRLKNNLQK